MTGAKKTCSTIEKLRAQAREAQAIGALGNGIDRALNPALPERRLGFFLFVYEFGEGPRANQMHYVSNTERADVLATLREMIAQMESRPHAPTAEPEDEY